MSEDDYEYPYAVEFIPASREDAERVCDVATHIGIHCTVVDPRQWFINFESREFSQELMDAVVSALGAIPQGRDSEVLEIFRERLESWLAWSGSNNGG